MCFKIICGHLAYRLGGVMNPKYSDTTLMSQRIWPGRGFCPPGQYLLSGLCPHSRTMSANNGYHLGVDLSTRIVSAKRILSLCHLYSRTCD